MRRGLTQDQGVAHDEGGAQQDTCASAVSDFAGLAALLCAQHQELLQRIDGLQTPRPLPMARPGTPEQVPLPATSCPPSEVQAKPAACEWLPSAAFSAGCLARDPKAGPVASFGFASASSKASSLAAMQQLDSETFVDRVSDRWAHQATMRANHLYPINLVNRRVSFEPALMLGRPTLACTRKLVAFILNDARWDLFIFMVVLFNTVLLGIDSAGSRTGTSPAWIGRCEVALIAVYATELMANVFTKGREAFRQWSLLLDLLIVLCGVMELFMRTVAGGNLALVKALKVFRIVRAVRLMSHCRQLVFLLSGMASSIPLLFWTFATLGLMVYVFAVLGIDVITPDLSNDPAYVAAYNRHFSDLGCICLTLVQAITLDSMGAIYKPMIKAAPWLAFYFFTFMLVASVAIMNLVTSILVETARRHADTDITLQRMASRAKARELVPKLEQIFKTIDHGDRGYMDLGDILDAPQAVQDEMKAISNRCDLVEIFQTLDYDDNGKVSIPEFIDGILRATDDTTPLELIRVMKIVKDIQATISGICEKLPLEIATVDCDTTHCTVHGAARVL